MVRTAAVRTAVLALAVVLALVGTGAEVSARAPSLKRARESRAAHAVGAQDVGGATIPYAFPLFKQCDARWGDDVMEVQTICEVGCLMSSVSMALAGTDIPIPVTAAENAPADATLPSKPKNLNEWLRNDGGYTDNDELIESVVPEIDPDRITWPDDGMHSTKDLSYDTVSEYLKDGRIVIANVMSGEHFVLCTGFDEDGDTFYVNDPGFQRFTYSYNDDVVGFRIFDMVRDE